MGLVDDIITEYRRGWTPSRRFVPPWELPSALLSGDPRLAPPTPRDVALLLLYPLKGR